MPLCRCNLGGTGTGHQEELKNKTEAKRKKTRIKKFDQKVPQREHMVGYSGKGRPSTPLLPHPQHPFHHW